MSQYYTFSLRFHRSYWRKTKTMPTDIMCTDWYDTLCIHLNMITFLSFHHFVSQVCIFWHQVSIQTCSLPHPTRQVPKPRPPSCAYFGHTSHKHSENTIYWNCAPLPGTSAVICSKGGIHLQDFRSKSLEEHQSKRERKIKTGEK